MHITHLSLANFRNYVRLELDLPSRYVVFLGDNAQGKTNLLEAVFFLATTRSPRTSSDRELVNWLAQKEDLPFTKVAGKVRKTKASIDVDITLMARSDEEGSGNGSLPAMGKRIRVNGLPKRATDLFGQVNVVMFSPEDIELVSGSPQLRRRYLDIMNSQIDSQYLRSLQSYSRVLVQRNHLLRLIRDHHAQRDQLAFWDDQLVESGAYVIVRRQETVSELNELAQILHPQLTGRQERLKVSYVPSVEVGDVKDEPALVPAATATAGGMATVREQNLFLSPYRAQAMPVIEKAFRESLGRSLEKEVALGMSVVGPHRDDLQFSADGIDLNVYGSRGQQRTAALSLKLAEAKLLRSETGETPIVLLDDVMSELDAERRCHLLEAIGQDEQVLITATDLDRYAENFLAGATVFRVSGGQVEKVTS